MKNYSDSDRIYIPYIYWHFYTLQLSFLKGQWQNSAWIMLIWKRRKVKWYNTFCPEFTRLFVPVAMKGFRMNNNSETNSPSNMPGKWRMSRLTRQTYFSTIFVFTKAEDKWMKKYLRGIYLFCIFVLNGNYHVFVNREIKTN
jgi:hypothetical protein